MSSLCCLCLVWERLVADEVTVVSITDLTGFHILGYDISYLLEGFLQVNDK